MPALRGESLSSAECAKRPPLLDGTGKGLSPGAAISGRAEIIPPCL